MDQPVQPDKCKNCYWGEWRETKQLCHKVKDCYKEPKPEKVKT